MSGAIYDNNAWLDRVHEMEEKVAKAEKESKVATEKIDETTKNQKIKIQEKQIVIKQFIEREVAKYDGQCIVPQEFIDAINKAAEK